MPGRIRAEALANQRAEWIGQCVLKCNWLYRPAVGGCVAVHKHLCVYTYPAIGVKVGSLNGLSRVKGLPVLSDSWRGADFLRMTTSGLKSDRGKAT